MITRSKSSSSPMEKLETRCLLSAPPNVLRVIADNRGEVQIDLSQTVTGVNATSVRIYTPGTDGLLNTPDDVRTPAAILYNNSKKRIIIRAKTPADLAYRVRMQSKLISAADGSGNHLDGEFAGTFPTGDGLSGGNFNFFATPDTSSKPVLRMSTSTGIITLRLFKHDAPHTVANYLNYANTGRFDNMFITRNIPGFIVQGGSERISSKNKITVTSIDASPPNEFLRSNVRGTIAMAKKGGDPNSATNQWFFNLADNSSNLNSQNGGFTVFGQLTNSSSLAAMDAMAGKDIVALKNPINGHGVGPDDPNTGLTDVPVQSKTGLSGQVEAVDTGMPPTTRFVVTGGLSPIQDLIVIRRTSVQMKVTVAT